MSAQAEPTKTNSTAKNTNFFISTLLLKNKKHYVKKVKA